MLRVAICEDEPLQTEVILGLLSEYQSVRSDLEVLACNFNSGSELLDSLESDRIFDIFLLDILMPGLNGIDLARELRIRGEEAPLVFLTSSADYALEAFSVHANQYILKPVKKEVLFPILDKIILSLDTEESFLFVSAPQRRTKISFSSIVCVESSMRTVRICLADGRKLTSKTIRIPFESAIAPLLKDDRFLHAHKSFVLNMALVDELTGSSFLMKDGTEVPVPRYKYANAKARYLGYLSKCGVDMLG